MSPKQREIFFRRSLTVISVFCKTLYNRARYRKNKLTATIKPENDARSRGRCGAYLRGKRRLKEARELKQFQKLRTDPRARADIPADRTEEAYDALKFFSRFRGTYRRTEAGPLWGAGAGQKQTGQNRRGEHHGGTRKKTSVCFCRTETRAGSLNAPPPTGRASRTGYRKPRSSNAASAARNAERVSAQIFLRSPSQEAAESRKSGESSALPFCGGTERDESAVCTCQGE